MIKGAIGIDYGVMPLEALYWTDDMETFSEEDKDAWSWTVMIMQPELITEAMVAEAIEQVRSKKNPPTLPLVRCESFTEGTV